MHLSQQILSSFHDELTKIADIPMSFFNAGSPMAQKAKQVASSAVGLAKKAPSLPAAAHVVSSAPPLSSLLKK